MQARRRRLLVATLTTLAAFGAGAQDFTTKKPVPARWQAALAI